MDKIERLFRKKLSRQEFIRNMVALGFSATAAGMLFSQIACSSKEITIPASTSKDQPDKTPDFTSSNTHLVVARGESPTAMVNAAVRKLGGIEQFVKIGNDVIIKPNLVAADYSYEYAAFTNPEVIGALTELCVSAGASRVRVMDYPTAGTSEQIYSRSGMADVVEDAGGQMEVIRSIKFQNAAIPEGKDITSWMIYGDVLDTDVFINVPIAKHHNLARLTLGMKNLMGVIENRNQFHINLGQRIADLNSLVRPTLTVVDAVRILTNNGPRGGSLNDVKQTNTIIASQDIVAADSYAATLFGLTGSDIPAIRAGADMGLGTMDLNNMNIEEISV
jgi:uncharacterized protein (DUF362 family)